MKRKIMAISVVLLFSVVIAGICFIKKNVSVLPQEVGAYLDTLYDDYYYGGFYSHTYENKYYIFISEEQKDNLLDRLKKNIKNKLDDAVAKYEFLVNYSMESDEASVNLFCDYSQESEIDIVAGKQIVKQLYEELLSEFSILHALSDLDNNPGKEMEQVNIFETKVLKDTTADDLNKFPICEAEKQIVDQFSQEEIFVIWSLGDGEYHVKQIQFLTKDEWGTLDLAQFSFLEKIDFGEKVINKVIFPDKMKYVNESTILNPIGIREIIFPDELKEIGPKTFEYCINLKSISFGDELEVLRYECFSQCLKLEKIVLKKNIKQLEKGTFSDCKELKEIVFKGDAPVISGDIAIDGVADGFTIYYDPNKKGWDMDYWKQYNLKPLE